MQNIYLPAENGEKSQTTAIAEIIVRFVVTPPSPRTWSGVQNLHSSGNSGKFWNSGDTILISRARWLKL